MQYHDLKIVGAHLVSCDAPSAHHHYTAKLKRMLRIDTSCVYWNWAKKKAAESYSAANIVLRL